MMVFDWDDTLFPTSRFDGSQAHVQYMKTHAPVLEAVLRTAAQSCHRVCIVTHAQRGWIDQCARYMPLNLIALCNELNIGVYYAREYPQFAAGETCEAKQVKKMKMGAMNHAMRDAFESSWDQQTALNVISIGDSHAERAAMFELLNGWAAQGRLNFQPYTKSAKFVENPTLPLLTLELQELMSVMRTLVGSGHLDLIAEVTQDFRSHKVNFVHAQSSADAEISRMCASQFARQAAAQQALRGGRNVGTQFQAQAQRVG